MLEITCGGNAIITVDEQKGPISMSLLLTILLVSIAIIVIPVLALVALLHKKKKKLEANVQSVYSTGRRSVDIDEPSVRIRKFLEVSPLLL